MVIGPGTVVANLLYSTVAAWQRTIMMMEYADELRFLVHYAVNSGSAAFKLSALETTTCAPRVNKCVGLVSVQILIDHH
jgi:hypothetical protein